MSCARLEEPQRARRVLRRLGRQLRDHRSAAGWAGALQKAHGCLGRSARRIHARGPPRAALTADKGPKIRPSTTPWNKKRQNEETLPTIAIASMLVVALSAACQGKEGRRRRRRAADKYDVNRRWTSTPVPSTLGRTPHRCFRARARRPHEAAVKPLDPATVKEVRLDTTHKVIEIAPGVKFTAWTFGGQVPGPAVRARVGDKHHSP